MDNALSLRVAFSDPSFFLGQGFPYRTAKRIFFPSTVLDSVSKGQQNGSIFSWVHRTQKFQMLHEGNQLKP